MKYEEPNHYTTDEGKTFRRKEDNFIMGNDMYLYNYIDDTPDKIENYEEVDDPDYINPKDKPETKE